jgi:hypothetical protein
MRSACGIAALIVLLSGCAIQPEATIACPEPRPELCTMEYAPTCAVYALGARKEFASPCTACADENTVGYVAGPCAGE